MSLRQFRRNLGETLFASLPELPIYTAQGPQKQPQTIKHQLLIVSTKMKYIYSWNWISVSKPLERVLGKNFHVDFESAIENTQFLQPHRKNQGKTTYMISNKIHIYIYTYIPFEGV